MNSIDEEQPSSVAGPEVLTTTLVVELSEEDLKRNRTYMTIAHFVLTYPRWSFSLFLLLASMSLPGNLPSVDDAITEPIRNLKALVKTEAMAHQDCVNHAFQSARKILNETAEAEWNRTRQIHTRNQELIHGEASKVALSCLSAEYTAHRALNQWHQLSSKHSVPWLEGNSTVAGPPCSADDKSHVLEQLYDTRVSRVILLRQQVDQLLHSWRIQNMEIARGLARYAQNRSDYDYNYFVGIKFQAILENLKKLQIDIGDIPVPSISEQDLLREINGILQNLVNVMQEAKARIEILTSRLEMFHSSIHKFEIHYTDVYLRLQMASDFVKDFLPSTIALPSYLSMDSVPKVDILMPPIFEVPTFDYEFPGVELNDLVASLVEALRRITTEMMDEMGIAFQLQLQLFLKSMHTLVSLEDYHPPEFSGRSSNDIDQELEFMEQSNEDLQNSIDHYMVDAMNGDHLDASESLLQNVSLPFGLKAPNFSDGDIGSNLTLPYLQPSFPEFSIPDALRNLLSFIISNQWILELAIQFFRIVRLKRKYEQNASPDLPEIDLVAHDNEEASFERSNWSLIPAALLQHLLTPWMILGLLFLPIAFFSATIWFPHVKRSCIDTRNGTFLAKEMIAPILINKASFVGAGLHDLQERKCRRLQHETCVARMFESDRIHRENLFSMQSLSSKYMDTQKNRDTFRRCLDLEKLDTQFEDACCGLEGYSPLCTALGDPALCPIDNTTVPYAAFLPIGSSIILSSGLCPANISHLWELEDGRFNCEEMTGICNEESCPGVDSSRLRWAAIDTDCEVETYIVQCCFLVLVALYHGFMVNLITSLAFQGTKRLRWRNLRPEGLKFRTHVAEDGRLVKGDSRQQRSHEIRQALKRFQAIGELQILLSVILSISWLITVFFLRFVINGIF